MTYNAHHVGAEDDSAYKTLCHDLRQYVATGLLLSTVPEECDLGAEAQRRLATINTLFDRVRLLIDADAVEPRPRRSRFNVAQIVDDGVRVAQVTSTVHIRTRLEAGVTAFGDPVLLGRAVANVLDNAVRACGAQGTIDVGVSESGDESLIEVADEGVGFGLAPHGSGLGLSVVAMAVEAFHGRLEIFSDPARGTTVRIVLPRTLVAR